MAAQPHLWPASQASLRILMSGQGFLKDFKAFGSQPSLAEVHFPLYFLDFLDFLDFDGFHDSGDPPPHFGPFSTNGFSWLSVRNKSFNQPGEET